MWVGLAGGVGSGRGIWVERRALRGGRVVGGNLIGWWAAIGSNIIYTHANTHRHTHSHWPGDDHHLPEDYVTGNLLKFQIKSLQKQSFLLLIDSGSFPI